MDQKMISEAKIKDYFLSLPSAEKIIAIQFFIDLLKDSKIRVRNQSGKIAITLLSNTKFADAPAEPNKLDALEALVKEVLVKLQSQQNQEGTPVIEGEGTSPSENEGTNPSENQSNTPPEDETQVPKESNKSSYAEDGYAEPVYFI